MTRVQRGGAMRWRWLVCAWAVLSAQGAHALQFRIERLNDDVVGLFGTGRIEPGDAERFQQLVRGQSGREVILFIDSPGGLLSEALELTSRIARWRMPIVVPPGGVCASACFLLLAGSPERAMAASARIGVHAASRESGEDVATMALTAALARAAKELGAPDSVVGKMVTTTPDQMAWLTQQELSAMRILVIPDGEVPRNASPSAPSPVPQSPPLAALPQERPPAPPSVSGFDRGIADRAAWEDWFNQQIGAAREGAAFWADQRSKPEPRPCDNPNPQFAAGCEAAKRRLSTSDALRRTDPEYRRGWNAYAGSASQQPAATASTTPPPAVVIRPAQPPAFFSPAAAARPVAAMRQRLKAAGMAGLKVSWQECEQIVNRNSNPRSAEYCLVMIYSAYLFDQAFSRSIGRPGVSSPGWAWDDVYPALARMFDVMQVPAGDRQAHLAAYAGWINSAFSKP